MDPDRRTQRTKAVVGREGPHLTPSIYIHMRKWVKKTTKLCAEISRILLCFRPILLYPWYSNARRPHWDYSQGTVRVAVRVKVRIEARVTARDVGKLVRIGIWILAGLGTSQTKKHIPVLWSDVRYHRLAEGV